MSAKNYTYTDAGVNREERHESKKSLDMLHTTYKYSRFGPVMHLPYSNVFQLDREQFLDLTIEGVGTKVLVAQLAGRHDTIGIDAVAMAVNDVIRSGATPLAISDNIHAKSSNPVLVKAWLEGITQGAKQAECPIVSGEIGDVAEIISGIREGEGFDMIVASIGIVKKEKLITGFRIKPGDAIIGLPSSGLHSNGITLARKILLKPWGGKYHPHDKPDTLDREIVNEVLEPTKIYVKPFLQLAEVVKIKAAVHITGDAYLKFNNLNKFSQGIGFQFYNFKPHPIFGLIQETAKDFCLNITDEEMFRTFNMGWGFGIIVDKSDKETALEILDKAGVQPEIIGSITKNEQQIIINHKNKKMSLS
jgi:phosphoribosylformylglycinamidine cyclo-ligase